MSKYMTNSKATQMSTMQQAHKALQSGPVSIALPTHKEIASRAHEIYAEKGYQQDQSEQNWLQAEQELKSQQHWLQVEQK